MSDKALPPKMQKKVESSEQKKPELPTELGDISSILKSGVNDSTQNDIQHSLDFGPSNSKAPPQDSGKATHKVSIPNNEQQDPIY